MKTTVIPAQITTVEDMITSNLSLVQLCLLVIPILTAALVFGLLPPFMHIRVYKLIISIFFSFPCLALALRIHDEILLKYLTKVLRYRLRPKLYLLTKTTRNECGCTDTAQTEPSALKVETRTLDLAPERVRPEEIDALKRELNGRRINYLSDRQGTFRATLKID